MTMKTVSVREVHFSNSLPFVLLAGPCVMESRDHAMMMVDRLNATNRHTQYTVCFLKHRLIKRNRTSVHGARGMGLEASLKVFEEIRQNFACPIVTDVHSPEQCQAVSGAVDILQIPAFLCRQTDLLQAAAATGLAINIKKGNFWLLTT